MSLIFRTRRATGATEDHEAKFGRWGTPLPNMREIWAEEFWQHSDWNYPFEAVEYRDIHEGEFAGLTLSIFYMHSDGGVAMASDYRGKQVHYLTFAA